MVCVHKRHLYDGESQSLCTCNVPYSGLFLWRANYHYFLEATKLFIHEYQFRLMLACSQLFCHCPPVVQMFITLFLHRKKEETDATFHGIWPMVILLLTTATANRSALYCHPRICTVALPQLRPLKYPYRPDSLSHTVRSLSAHTAPLFVLLRL